MKDDPFYDERFVQAVIEETRRRGIRASGECSYCGLHFIKQDPAVLVAHMEECEERQKQDG